MHAFYRKFNRLEKHKVTKIQKQFLLILGNFVQVTYKIIFILHIYFCNMNDFEFAFIHLSIYPKYNHGITLFG